MSTNTVLASAPLTTTGFHIKATGTTLGNSLIWDNGTNVGIGNTNTSYTLDVSGTGRFTSSLTSDTLLVNATAQANVTALIQGKVATAGTALKVISDGNGTDKVFEFTGADGVAAQTMTMLQSGNVGIGTSSPNNKLDVSGNTVLNGTVSFGTAAAAANSFTFYQNYSVGQPGTDWYSSTGAVIFGFNGNTKALFLGNLTGGATTLSTDASGNIIRTPSDINLKTNIEDLQYGLETIMQLRPIIHNWKESIDTEEKSINMGEGKSIGFIAQEVELLVPEIVCGDEYKSIDYPKMVAILTKAIQELSKQNEELSNRLIKLENK